MKHTRQNSSFVIRRLGCSTWLCMLALGVSSCAVAPKPSTRELVDRLEAAQSEGSASIKQRLAALQAEADLKLSTQQKVRTVVDRWINTQGGRRRVENLKNIRLVIRVKEGYRRDFLRTVETATGAYRFDAFGREGVLCGGFDGTRGWYDNGEWGRGVYPGQRGAPAWMTNALQALQLEKTLLQGRSLPDETVAGRVCDVLAVSAEGNHENRWFFDRLSGLLLRTIKNAGSDQELITSYADYRPVSKIGLPFEITVSAKGQITTSYSVVEAKINGSLQDQSFLPTESFLKEVGEIDELLKRSVESGWKTESAGLSCLTQAIISSTTSGVRTSLKVFRRNPGLVLVEKETVGMGRTVSGYDGKTGWENSEILGYHELNGGEVGNLFSLSWLGVDPFLRERFPLRSKLGATTIGDRKTTLLRLRNFNGLSGKFYFDQETARLLRVEMEENVAAHVQAMKVEYSDYRAVGEFAMPFRVAYDMGGSDMVITCSSVEFGVDLPEPFFKPRKDTE